MERQPVGVATEIGRLRRVLVHEPGLEVDHMVPSAMDELLFDDVLFGDRAREEHGLVRAGEEVIRVTGGPGDDSVPGDSVGVNRR